jgi:hypothetical protein
MQHARLGNVDWKLAAGVQTFRLLYTHNHVLFQRVQSAIHCASCCAGLAAGAALGSWAGSSAAINTPPGN